MILQYQNVNNEKKLNHYLIGKIQIVHGVFHVYKLKKDKINFNSDILIISTHFLSSLKKQKTYFQRTNNSTTEYLMRKNIVEILLLFYTHLFNL